MIGPAVPRVDILDVSGCASPASLGSGSCFANIGGLPIITTNKPGKATGWTIEGNVLRNNNGVKGTIDSMEPSSTAPSVTNYGNGEMADGADERNNRANRGEGYIG